LFGPDVAIQTVDGSPVNTNVRIKGCRRDQGKQNGVKGWSFRFTLRAGEYTRHDVHETLRVLAQEIHHVREQAAMEDTLSGREPLHGNLFAASVYQ
jgi:hypothetical protein